MALPKLANLALWGQANAYSEARAYRHPHTGKHYPSITSVLKMADKSGLAQWAADLAMKWAVENASMLLSMSTERGYNAGRYRWRDVRDERAEVGTAVHETIEAELTGSWSYPELDWEQKLIVEEWHQFIEEHEVEFLLSEFTVFDEESGSMGTGDIYCKIDGVLSLVDLKTSKNTWPEHFYQLAALWHAKQWLIETEEMLWTLVPAREVEQVVIIHLRAPEFDEWGRKTREGKHDLIRVKNLPENYEIYKSYAKVWHAKQALRELEKEQELITNGF